MLTNGCKLVHVSPRVQARGGIETLHDHQRAAEGPQHFLALFDRGPQPRPDYTNLDFTWRTPLWRMRRAVRRALAAHAPAVVIYHHGWGLPLFHDVDGAERRIFYCEGSPDYHARDLRASAGLIDGVLAIAASPLPALRGLVPGLSPERMQVVPLPIAVPDGLRRQRGENEVLVLGCVGRVERRHKRVDRLPRLLRELRATGRRFKFEVLGDGTWRKTLERQVSGEVTFHGWVAKDEFWRVIARWDAAVFFSDMEGGPIALLEAAAVGAIPFFPAIGGSLGDDYAPRVDRRCLYPPGDMTALARSVHAVFAESAQSIAAARQRAHGLAAQHAEARYGQAVAQFAGRIEHLPRLARPQPRRPRLTDALPLGFVTRVMPWGLRSG